MNDWLSSPDAHLNPVVAEAYDSSSSGQFATETISRTVDVLEEMAEGGVAAEFAVGTGRIALPLAARGVEVHGLDFSEPMLAQLRAKPDAHQVQVTLGDMTSTVLGQDFLLVYLIYNTIMNLRTQQLQVECFANAAAHLRPGGRFVVENMVPQLRRLNPGESIVPFNVSQDHLGFEEYADLVNQISISHHYHLNGNTVRTNSPAFRYVWPSELDLMAQMAGLELENRWADWDKSQFTGESSSHVSVWRKPA